MDDFLNRGRVKLDYQCTGTVYCGTASRSASGTRLHYGLGVEYAFARNGFARAEYEVFVKVGDSLGADGTSGTSQKRRAPGQRWGWVSVLNEGRH